MDTVEKEVAVYWYRLNLYVSLIDIAMDTSIQEEVLLQCLGSTVKNYTFGTYLLNPIGCIDE